MIRSLIAFALSAFALNAEVRVAVVLPEGRELQAITKITWDGKVVACRCIDRSSLRVRTSVIDVPRASKQRFQGKDIERVMRQNYGADVFSKNDTFDLVYLNASQLSDVGDPYETVSESYAGIDGDSPHSQSYRMVARFPTTIHEFAQLSPNAFALIVPIASISTVADGEPEIKKRIRIFNGFVIPEQAATSMHRESMSQALLRRMIFLALDPPAQKRRRLPESFSKLTVHVRYADGTAGKLRRLMPAPQPVNPDRSNSALTSGSRPMNDR